MPFARMNADPRVMECMPNVMSLGETDAQIERIQDHFAAHGYASWALERKDTGEFIGYTGLMNTPYETAFTPCVELAWRLDHAHWGKGYAIEAAKRAVQFAFEDLALHELVAFTVPHNTRSRKVMERLGMNRDASEDFDHPRLPEGHPLRRHVLYRLASSSRTEILGAKPHC